MPYVKQRVHVTFSRTVFGDAPSVKQFPAEVSVPPDGGIHGHTSLTYHLAFHIAYATRSRRPHLQPPVGRVYVGCHPSSHILVCLDLEDNLASRRIAEGRPVTFVLVYVPHLQSVAVREETRHMNCVPMSHTCVVQSCSVMVNTHRTVYYLVLAVGIHITHTQVVVALTAPQSPPVFLRVEKPPPGQGLAVPVPCSESGTRIIAPAHHHTRMHAVKVSHTGKVSFTPVAVVVAPVAGIP